VASLLVKLAADEVAQDPIEYVLLLAFVVMCSAALFITNGGAIATIWQTTNDSLSAAHSMAS
jgi:Flp pilus assembly pilin Flp